MFAGLLAFSALPTVLLGYADGYWSPIGVGFLLGVADSSFAVGVPFVARWYACERQGTAVGIYGMGNVGTALASGTGLWPVGVGPRWAWQALPGQCDHVHVDGAAALEGG